jgi:hypothetical protein
MWLTAYTLIGLAFMTAGQALCGLERVGALAVSLSAAAISTVALSILFAHSWGLAGVAAAMGAAKLGTYLPLQVHQINRLLRTSAAPRDSRVA